MISATARLGCDPRRKFPCKLFDDLNWVLRQKRKSTVESDGKLWEREGNLFGFGNRKKRYLDELSKTLSEFGNIPKIEAQSFLKQWEQWVISETLTRNLDPISGAINLAEKSLERIVLAHHLKKYDGASVVPDFMLLIALKAGMFFRQAEEQTGIKPPNSFLSLAVQLPVDVQSPKRTYREVLNELVANDPDVSGNF